MAHGWVLLRSGYFSGGGFLNSLCGLYMDKIKCKCGKSLTARIHSMVMNKLNKLELITVCEPCPKCLDEKYRKGYAEGHKDGESLSQDLLKERE